MKQIIPLLPHAVRLVVAGATLVAASCANLSPKPETVGDKKDMNLPTTALLVLDMQNDFCGAEGALNSLVADELARTNILDNNVRLIRAAHAKGLPIVLSPIHIDYSATPLQEPQGIVGAVVANKAFDKASRGSELAPAIAQFVGMTDVQVMPKPGLSAFANTDLHKRLGKLGIQTVVISGLLTNYCVESTARDAYDLGCRVQVISDATATFDESQQEHAVQVIFPMLGGTLDLAEFEAAIGANI